MKASWTFIRTDFGRSNYLDYPHDIWRNPEGRLVTMAHGVKPV